MTWTWWMTLLVIFAVLVLIGCIPVGVDARYSADGVFLTAKLGPFLLQLLPQKPKKKPKKRKPQQKQPKKTPAKAEPQEKKPNPLLSGGVDGLMQLLDLAFDTLGDLRRKLRVNELTLYVLIGGAGAGIKITPVAFLVIRGENVRMLPVAEPASTSVDRLIELLPDLLEKGEAYFAEKKAAKEAEKAAEQA